MSKITGRPLKPLLSPSIQNSRAECLAYTSIQKEASLAVWQNQADRVQVQNTGIHTLSFYIAGGYDAYRSDMKHCRGGPKKLCFFPAGHQSEWNIGTTIRFLHLYFTDTYLNYLALTVCDLDPQRLQLSDFTFESDPNLVAGLQYLLGNMNSAEMSNGLLLQDIQQQLVLHLLAQYSKGKVDSIRGGLSPKVQARVIEYMRTHLDQDIALEQLADLACMSTYHFSHMFKQSTGLSPYQFLLNQRMDLATRELRNAVPIGQVGEHCGYSSPSRFARIFKNRLGVTPLEYQRLKARTQESMD